MATIFLRVLDVLCLIILSTILNTDNIFASCYRQGK
jgi:hypothetical protein